MHTIFMRLEFPLVNFDPYTLFHSLDDKLNGNKLGIGTIFL